MTTRPPISTRSATPFPTTTLCRSEGGLHRHPHRSGGQQRHDVALHGASRGGLVLERAGPQRGAVDAGSLAHQLEQVHLGLGAGRSEEHTSELQSLMRISYAVFCVKKKRTYTREREIRE